MTEVEKFQGKFLERQRLEKERAKQEQKLAKATKKPEEVKKENGKQKKEKEEVEVEDDGLTEKEKMNLRKYLEDGCEFKGVEKTAVAVLKKAEEQQMKLRKLARQLSQIYKLSEDFDSDSDASENEDSWIANRKKVAKKLKKIQCEKLQIEGKIIKLVSAK